MPQSEEPRLISKNRYLLRLRLLQEELDELQTAAHEGDMIEILDALCDLQVVLDGTFLEYGMYGIKKLAMHEVHRSNMSKLDENGKPIIREDGKVLKGPKFSRPNLAPLFNDYE